MQASATFIKLTRVPALGSVLKLDLLCHWLCLVTLYNFSLFQYFYFKFM